METNSQADSLCLNALCAAGIGVWNWNLSSDTVVYSPEWKQLRGCAEQNVTDSVAELLSRVHPDDRENLEAKRTRLVLGQDESFSFDYRVQLIDESWIWVEERTRAVRDDDGTVVRLVGCEIDITQRKRKERRLDDAASSTAPKVDSLPTAMARFDPVKRAEKELKELNQRLHNVLEFSSIGIWVWYCEDERLVWDEKMHEIYGVDAKDFRGVYSDWSDRLHPGDLDRIMAEDQCRAESNQQLPQEFRIVRPNGEVRYIYANVYMELDEHGKPVRATGVNVDITDRRETEFALLESEKKLQRIADHLPGMVYQYFLDSDGTHGFKYLSSQVRELFGFEPAELISNSELLWQWIDPSDSERLVEKMHESARDLSRHQEEFRVSIPDRGTRWFQANSQPKQITNDGVVWDGVILEITDRKTVEIELQEAKYQLERITENVPGMIFRQVYSQMGDHFATFVSSKSIEMFGVSPEEGLADATKLWQWIHPEDMESLKEKVESSARNLVPLAAEYRVTPPNDSIRWYHVTGQPEKLENGDVTLDGVVLDVTDRKRAEIQLQLANDELAKATRMKDGFLANMSHELRTPLSAILGMTEGLQQGIFGSVTGKQQDSCDVIEQSASHLLTLINEVLDLAKIESGSVDLEFTAVEIPELCKSSLQLIAQQAEKKNIQLNLSVQFNLPVIEADEKRLRQILINLLSNATKFTPDNGQVTLEVKRLESNGKHREEMVRFSVTDTGIGIDESNFESLFQPFIQVDTALNRNYEGTGLGLALVKQFVELHSGHVGLASELGVGSCFSVDLPFRQTGVPVVAPLAVKRKPKNSGELADESSTFILLAEDNELVAKTTTHFLEASNFRVQLVGDGQAAIDMAREHLPDAILMDVQMPGVDGLEAIRRLREMPAFKETPIIALTGLAMQGDSKRCLAAGANLYLSKPYRMQELVESIRTLLPQRTPS